MGQSHPFPLPLPPQTENEREREFLRTFPLAELHLHVAFECLFVIACWCRLLLKEFRQSRWKTCQSVRRPGVWSGSHDTCQNVLTPVACQGLRTWNTSNTGQNYYCWFDFCLISQFYPSYSELVVVILLNYNAMALINDVPSTLCRAQLVLGRVTVCRQINHLSMLPPELGHRAFPVTGTCIWNDLPLDITCSPSLHSFKQRLKMHLFPRSYPGLVFELFLPFVVLEVPLRLRLW